MSNEQNYRPRSPDLPAFGNQPPPPPRLQRLPSYTIQEPVLPKGYSFSPRGSYDASPFFSPVSQHPSSSYFSSQLPTTSPQAVSASLPDLHSQHQQHIQTQQQSPPIQSVPFSGQTFHATYTHSPPRVPQGHNTAYHNAGFTQTQQNHQLYHQPFQPYHDDEMARLRQRKPVNYNENHNGPSEYEQPQSYPSAAPPPPPPPPVAMMSPTPMLQHPFNQTMQSVPSIQPMPHMPPALQPEMVTGPLVLPRVDVRTKFPVARIKRIMQADEDVGKVAQATPSAVSKALELFMIALVTKGASEAKSQNSKRVTATHLKSALLKDPQFDFLREICEVVPDEGSKKRAKSETKDSDSEDEAVEGKRKGKPRKKKTGSEMESD